MSPEVLAFSQGDGTARHQTLYHFAGHYRLSNDGVVAPLPPGMAPNIWARFERDPGERRKGLYGQHAFPLLGDETTGTARSGVAGRRRNETQGFWSYTSDALPGTEFAEGVSPEADSGEFSDDLWSNQSHGRLRENHIPAPDHSESLVVIWT